ncbi:hypothetical protein F4778DRAFT_313477 [Xylariomycetidae sp. FL2044]|nr:hypothetical protein F4778DRAFT_313477 [Xylariomycetidae sp. FL2044]
MASRRISNDDWDNYKQFIYQRYIDERIPAKMIIEEMRTTHNLLVAPYQLKQQISAWNMRKNLSPADQTFITSQENRRTLVGGSKEYRLTGQTIPQSRESRRAESGECAEETVGQIRPRRQEQMYIDLVI